MMLTFITASEVTTIPKNGCTLSGYSVNWNRNYTNNIGEISELSEKLYQILLKQFVKYRMGLLCLIYYSITVLTDNRGKNIVLTNDNFPTETKIKMKPMMVRTTAVPTSATWSQGSV